MASTTTTAQEAYDVFAKYKHMLAEHKQWPATVGHTALWYEFIRLFPAIEEKTQEQRDHYDYCVSQVSKFDGGAELEHRMTASFDAAKEKRS